MKVFVHGDSLYAWVAAGALAETGNAVAMDAAANSHFPEREPGLELLLDKQRHAGRLQCDCPLDDAREAGVHILASVGDPDQLRRIASHIVPLLTAPSVLLVMASLPVGTLDSLQSDIDRMASASPGGHGATVIGMPLFIREGSALADFYRPANLLLSGPRESAAMRLVLELLRPFARKAEHLMLVSHPAAELIKLGVTAMLAMRVSFINEMAALAARLDVDIEQVREGLAADPRIGSDYLQPGCGFGGPSLTHELTNYLETVKLHLNSPGLIGTVMAINDSQREVLFRKLWRFFRGRLSGRVVAIWGAAFKPGTASLDNSVVHPLLTALWAQGCTTVVYDPMAGQALSRQYAGQPLLVIAPTAVAAVQDADALVVVTAWEEFWNPDFDRVKAALINPVIFDGRNIYNPDYLKKLGFRYFGIGRGETV